MPTLLGGDFNLVRSAADKSNGVINCDNDRINRWSLIDFKRAKRSFTWSNNQNNLTMTTLDRVLASTNWLLIPSH